MAAVNSEGEVPSDIAEEAAMKDLLLEQVKKQGKSVVGLNMSQNTKTKRFYKEILKAFRMSVDGEI